MLITIVWFAILLIMSLAAVSNKNEKKTHGVRQYIDKREENDK